MQLHNWHTLGWVIWGIATVGFFIYWEWLALASRHDRKQPLTFFIRKAVGDPNNPLWWVLLGGLLWAIYHFLFRH